MAATVMNRQARVAVSPARLARTAERALAALGRAAGDVDVLVVDDPAIKRLNRAHRGVDRRTDVLAFPLETPGTPSPLVGQIVISAETARRQARRLEVALATELDLLVTHGVLHLVGYDDRDPIEARLMHERERAILSTGRRQPPARLWRGLLDALPITHGARDERRKPDRRPTKRAVRSHAASVSGHPRSKPASRTSPL
ncbi:MAG: rRNA maturation RNase YbeY [Candidatus Rokuibacteriota bacterium]|nr:MAG: rRNA maturation RNase YbeY [Candidatus Rokubacteria bacterium]